MTKDERMRAWMLNMEKALEILIESSDYRRGDEVEARLARAREHRRARFGDAVLFAQATKPRRGGSD